MTRVLSTKNIRVLNPRKSIALRLLRLITNPRNLWAVLKARIGNRFAEIRWDERVREHGAYAVIDIRHTPEEFEHVTVKQKEIIFPYFKDMLIGSEKTLLDFGCGSGRFTHDLVSMIGGSAIGYDPTKKLIELCRSSSNIFFTDSDNFLENPREFFDVIWVCLVLGGMSNEMVLDISSKLSKKLIDNGLFFLVEITGKDYVEGAWRTRPVEFYENLFPLIAIKKIGEYCDIDQEISIFAGRRSCLS